ncbi:PREDICTED: uncharacterized protein LOC109115317 [Nelumbo nucifera]|uniref:Uncharacterized protein LOC109115317 n=1 Tax=Nelumbo nucifera TaxID=4432 RepID=A0A1U8Q836_NELNU|nr:PREDICTED: uncharacterized protein LOC109115317 [Nelumbo nucifera]
MEQQRHFIDSTNPLLEDPTRYRCLVGRLVYLTVTRPYISFAANCLSQHMQMPRQERLDAALRVVRYLKGTFMNGLFFNAMSEPMLCGYCDSDWASCPLTRRSTTEYLTLLGTSLLSWKTKKQTTVSRSSTEAKYRAMATRTAELLWLKRVLHDLTINTPAMQLRCNSKATFHIAANPMFHEHTKHIDIDCHFVCEHVQSGEIKTLHLPSNSQPADLFTKALGSDKFHHLVTKLGIQVLHAPT